MSYKVFYYQTTTRCGTPTSVTKSPTKGGHKVVGGRHFVPLAAVAKYGRHTNQLLVPLKGQAKTLENNPLHEAIPYSSLRMVCMHGGSYRGHRKDAKPAERLILVSQDGVPCFPEN